MSTIFAITVKYSSAPKRDVFERLSPLCLSLVVSEELHYNQRTHHHIFLRSYQPVDLNRIRLTFNQIYQLNPSQPNYADILHIESCRSEKTWLKYITKQDADPLVKGIEFDKLSFYCKAIQWARNTRTFDVKDPFVMGYPQFYKLLELVHKSVRSQIHIDQITALRPFFYTFNQGENNWHRLVIEWWNDWVVNGWTHKKKQLYLYGASNTGKTTLIHRILSSCLNPLKQGEEEEEFLYERMIYCPMPNEPKYAMQNYDQRMHKLIVIDEFDISQYQVNDLKKLLAGESLMINSKNESGRVITHRNPIILISNLDPPSDRQSVNYRGVAERLCCIEADLLIQD